MKITCRCCQNPLLDSALLVYENMPKSAQYFPTKETVEEEKGVDLELYQCPYCGLLQIPGEPVSYYRDVIRATSVSPEMTAFRLLQFEQFVSTYELEGKKIIEVGAGSGEYMGIMAETSAQVYGLEHLPESVRTGKERGLQMFEGFVEGSDTQIPEAPYDAFYIMNFLEHIPEPNAFLQGIFHNLTEEGVGIVEVPNVDMILDKLLFSEFISDHLMYFSQKSLQTLLEKNGFEVLSCRVLWYDYIISAVVKKRKLVDVQGFLSQRKKITQSVHEYLDNQKELGRKVATWGAGHQALADLSLTGIEKKVACVIDSAEFKQNKYTPATHLPIVSPSVLKEGNIKTVLVMAAGFCDEVARIIQRDYPEVHIGILRDYGVEIVRE